jgi:murein L,D-transpeptidase YcbB/YkuD
LFFLTFESNKKSRIVNSLGDLADLDLLLRDAFFYLSRHLELGKIDPASLKSHWKITSKSKKADYGSLLTEGNNARDIRRQLEKLYLDFTMYRKGREVLRALNGQRRVDALSWKWIKIDKSIKVGDENNSISALRRRLKFWGYPNDYILISEKHYDSTMWLGVKSFQKNNGMEVDGEIGEMTGQALNASPSDLMNKA